MKLLKAIVLGGLMVGGAVVFIAALPFLVYLVALTAAVAVAYAMLTETEKDDEDR